MNRLRVFLLILIFLVTTTGVILAQGSGYSISRWSVGSVGSHSGGGYQLYALVGQPEAGGHSSGEGYTLTSGPRPSKALPQTPQQEKVYIPMVVRGP